MEYFDGMERFQLLAQGRVAELREKLEHLETIYEDMPSENIKVRIEGIRDLIVWNSQLLMEMECFNVLPA